MPRCLVEGFEGFAEELEEVREDTHHEDEASHLSPILDEMCHFGRGDEAEEDEENVEDEGGDLGEDKGDVEGEDGVELGEEVEVDVGDVKRLP